jgi:hypothetical protein
MDRHFVCICICITYIQLPFHPFAFPIPDGGRLFAPSSPFYLFGRVRIQMDREIRV